MKGNHLKSTNQSRSVLVSADLLFKMLVSLDFSLTEQKAAQESRHCHYSHTQLECKKESDGLFVLCWTYSLVPDPARSVSLRRTRLPADQWKYDMGKYRRMSSKHGLFVWNKCNKWKKILGLLIRLLRDQRKANRYIDLISCTCKCAGNFICIEEYSFQKNWKVLTLNLQKM